MDRKIIIFSKFLNSVMTYEFNEFGDLKLNFVCWILSQCRFNLVLLI